VGAGRLKVEGSVRGNRSTPAEPGVGAGRLLHPLLPARRRRAAPYGRQNVAP